ncbi:PKD domain-containing protein [Zobellia russellii]|uniref:PKD domain-containing protein n=1 Tax=Zobellia russellii TaxID=248907 RepID=UPI001BFEF8B2|nr:PKD domain-containing protein [Zobellia russellii]MBT9187574.1 PKD domain-containing protein [Zobellia russellii]
MKKAAYLILFMFFIFSTPSCEQEDYRDVNITQDMEERATKEFVGDLTSNIIVKDLEGAMVNEIDMGKTFFVIDNTEGNSDTSEWTITKGDETITSKEQMVRLNFSNPGEAIVKLTSTRSSDGKSTTSETSITIKSVPVKTSFITQPVDNGAAINIYSSNSITFTNTSQGSPTEFNWVFESPDETLTSTEENPTITFLTPGIYNVSLTAKRDDGDEGISEDTIQKMGYIQVEQLVVELIRAVATDSKIELQFTQPISQDIPANAISEFMLTVNTNNGTVLTPDIISIEATGEKTVELTFSDKMYSDDEVLVSFNPTGILKDATNNYIPEMFTEEPCVYGHNLWSGTDTEDESKFALSNNSSGSGFFKFVNENSAELPMEPYQGRSCIGFVRGDDKIGLSVMQGYTVAEGDVVVLAYEGKRIEDVAGALERRMSTTMASGGNDANGNWSSVNSNGGDNEWITVTKTINVSGDTNGNTGELFLTFFRYGGNSDTAALWIDNLRIYKPNPRP